MLPTIEDMYRLKSEVEQLQDDNNRLNEENEELSETITALLIENRKLKMRQLTYRQPIEPQDISGFGWGEG